MVRLDWCEIQDVRNGSSNVTEKYFCSLLNFSVKAPQLRVEARWWADPAGIQQKRTPASQLWLWSIDRNLVLPPLPLFLLLFEKCVPCWGVVVSCRMSIFLLLTLFIQVRPKHWSYSWETDLCYSLLPYNFSQKTVVCVEGHGKQARGVCSWNWNFQHCQKMYVIVVF